MTEVSPEELVKEYEQYIGSAKEKFEWVISFMALKDRFCFEVLSMMQKIPKPGFGTMGVALQGSKIRLYFDPEFLHGLSKEELRYVLAHEVMHVVLHHVTKRSPVNPLEHKLYNIAMDLAINCLLPDDSERFAPRFREDQVDKKTGEVWAKKGDLNILRPSNPKFGFPDHLSSENYVKLLRDKVEAQSDLEGFLDAMAEDGAMDKHEGWGPNELVDDLIKRKIDHIDKHNLWGNVSESFKEIVKSAQITQIPWRRHLRHSFGSIVHHTTRPTFKKPDRRFGYPYSGKVRTTTDKTLVGWDTSGSVPTKDIEQMLAETNKLATSMPVDLMMFDCELQSEKAIPWDKRAVQCGIKGRGGTNFQALVDYSDKHGYKNLVIFTDGYAPEPTIPKAKNVIWVITPGGKCPVTWGKVVQITSREEV